MTKKYDENSITVHLGLDKVRGNPSMYVGSTSSDGVSTACREPLDNVIDEILAGRASKLSIVIETKAKGARHAPGTFKLYVSDNGTGIPTGKHKKLGISTLQVVTQELHAGGKLSGADNSYEKGSIGTHGIGIKALNALSKSFEVYTKYKGYWESIGYKKGKIKSYVGKSKRPQQAFKQGTTLVAVLDPKMWDKNSYLDIGALHAWSEIMSYTLGVKGEINVKHICKGKTVSDTRYKTRKITDYLKRKSYSNRNILGAISTNNRTVDLVLGFLEEGESDFMGLTHGLHNTGGGSHLDQLWKSLYVALKPHKLKRHTFNHSHLEEGTVGFINWKGHSPKFSGQSKEILRDERATTDVKTLEAELISALNKDKKLARLLCDGYQNIHNAYDKFKLDRTIGRKIRGKTKRPNAGKVSKAPHCKVSEREVFLVEGDSAGGTARGARMPKTKGKPRFQEIVPLKGKPPNSYTSTEANFFNSEEVLLVLRSIGFDPDKKNPLDGLRCSMIGLLADPDPDGMHINLLLLGLFYKYMPEIYDRGLIYVVKGPKYVLSHKGEQYFGDSIKELEDLIPKGVPIANASYLKGWGEANSDSMRDIAFNPKTRNLVQITSIPKKLSSQFTSLLTSASPEKREIMWGRKTLSTILDKEEETLIDFGRKCLHEYGFYVIENRAIPGSYDGLKPVQRRILYATKGLGLLPSKSLAVKKSSRVVGDTIGKYHPHGDTSVYEAAVSMANQNYPLLTGSGNWGTLIDSPAAMRYTEVRMSKFAEKMLFNPRLFRVTKMIPNFDGSEQEPLELPAMLPMLLLNGASAIAVGATTNILSYSLESVLKVVKTLLKKPKKIKTDYLAKTLVPQLYSYGNVWPDPQDLDYDDPEELEYFRNTQKQYMETGSGTIEYVPEWDLDEKTRTIKITGFPPYAKISGFTKKGVPSGGLDKAEADARVSSVDDDSPLAKGMEKVRVHYNIKLKSTIPVSKLWDEAVDLMSTAFYHTIPMRLVSINIDADTEKKQIVQSSLRGYLLDWKAKRIMYEVLAIKYEIEQEKKKQARLSLLLTAVNNIDTIVLALKMKKGAHKFLTKKLKLDSESIYTILGFKLRQLMHTEATKVKQAILASKLVRKSLKVKLKHPEKEVLRNIKELG